MARTATYVHSKDEIKKNAKLIQETFSRLGEKVKLTHSYEVATVLAGYKTANAIVENSARDLTVVIGGAGSGKTTWIVNNLKRFDTKDTLVIDYADIFARDKRCFQYAAVMPLNSTKDAELIIRILPLFKTIIVDESDTIFGSYPELFAHVLYGNASTVITAQNKRGLESAGLVFKNEPDELLFTVGSQAIAIHAFINPHIGRKEFESLDPLQALQANRDYIHGKREDAMSKYQLEVVKLAVGSLKGLHFDKPLAIVSEPGVGKNLLVEEIVKASDIYEIFEGFMVDWLNAYDVVMAIKSMSASKSKLLYFDIHDSLSGDQGSEVILEATAKEFGVCLGFTSEESFEKLSYDIEFSGVIRTDGKIVNYSYPEGTMVLGYDFSQVSRW